MKDETGEVVLRGLPVAKGIGIGFPVFLSSFDEKVSESCISKKHVEQEILRYREALEKSRRDIENLQKNSIQEGSSEIAAILGTHLEMMHDPFLTSLIEEKIRMRQQKIETVFFYLIEECKQRFLVLQDMYFQERVRDVVDVSRRILNHLSPKNNLRISEIPHNSILIAGELVPSETIEASASTVSAFVTLVGGITSHAAIIARAKGIPFVADIDIKRLQDSGVKSLIVDGSQGVVILNPTHATLKKYAELKRGHVEKQKQLKSATHLKGETIDGYEVRVFANLENPDAIKLLDKSGASGVGLFRSEYLFLSTRKFPTEEEQFEIYKKMAVALRGRPLVVRVFDIGGDKRLELFPHEPDAKYFTSLGVEANPALGCRSIRFLLRYPDLLRAQLRALARASVYGDIQILIPMVSDIMEVRRVRDALHRIQAELAEKESGGVKPIPLGCMIEVPAAALICDFIVREVDFISIGTNDLEQFVLAADRNNPHISSLYSGVHPGLLRLIRMIVSSAGAAHKPVFLCGECVADPALIPVLMGLGIREFSVALNHIPLVKHTIRKWRILEACRLAEGALEQASASDLREYLAGGVKASVSNTQSDK